VKLFDPHDPWDPPRRFLEMFAKLKEYIASGENLTYGSFNSLGSLDPEGNPVFK